MNKTTLVFCISLIILFTMSCNNSKKVEYEIVERKEENELNITSNESEEIKEEVSDISKGITFEELLEIAGMEFSIPLGYKEIDPIGNRQMNYEKAYKHKSKNYEVRYAIRPHDYDFHKQIFEMTTLNISGGQLPKYSIFNS